MMENLNDSEMLQVGHDYNSLANCMSLGESAEATARRRRYVVRLYVFGT